MAPLIPSAVATLAQRVQELVQSHHVDASWRARAIALTHASPLKKVLEEHAPLAKLFALDQGWLDRQAHVRVADIYPMLRDIEVCRSMQLELSDDLDSPQTGPLSDFDPLNSLCFASIHQAGIWFSLVCLPSESPRHWPVVQCDPSAGDDAVMTVAVNFEHFLHEWLCQPGHYFASPLTETPPEIATELIKLMSTIYGIHTRLATANLAMALREDQGDHATLNESVVPPFLDPSLLRRLDRLAILPD